jgi:CBS domain-containing protein
VRIYVVYSPRKLMATVSDCMTREVYAVAPDTSLETAGRILYGKHVSGMPVVDAAGNAVGVITAKDLADPDRLRGERPGTAVYYHLSANGGCATHEAGPVRSGGVVSDVMTPFVVAVPHTTRLDDVMRLMIADDIHRVIVLDERKQIVGIVSSMDVIRAMLAER